jgi:hypothetical protein
VGGHVELGNDPNSPITGVFHHIPNLIVSVEFSIRTLLVQFWEGPAFHTETLILRKMPMQDIHLDGGHAIQIPLDDLDWQPVAADIQE